jgi:hypothetical protein
MPNSNKYLKLNKDVLLQWTFNTDELVTENYKILSNLKDEYKLFISDSSNFNNLENTFIEVDSVINKFTKADLTKYNFLQTQNYFTNLIQYDKLRLYFPISFSFSDNGYKGLMIKIYSYDFYNKKKYYFSNYFFDDELIQRQTEINFNTPFLYDENQWSKYIEFKVPSIDSISKQRNTNNNGSNTATQNTVNSNLTNNIGISDSSPIFIEFRFITSTQNIFGTKYYFTSSPYTTSISKTPDYQTISCDIRESLQGDYFEISGLYAGSNENLDDYIDYLESIGKKIRIEYDVALYEENILQRIQTFSIIENFSQTILYRPIITFSNTTAYIQVTMKIIDLVNGSIETKLSSIGLTNNLFKYGVKLIRINVDNAYKPKIYNNKSEQLVINNGQNIPTIITTKVNFPLLVETFKIFVGSSNSNVGNAYKGLGLLEIVLNPFNNIMKFKIAKNIENNQIVPYDLTDLLLNSKLVIVFKSESNVLEKELYYETNENDYKNGIIVFKLESSDISIIKKVKEENNRFYITINSDSTKSKTMLYYGTFQLLENIKPSDNSNSNSTFSNLGSNLDNLQNDSIVLNQNNQNQTPNANTSNNIPFIPPIQENVNLLLFIKQNINKVKFENSLKNIINFTKQVNTDYNFTYFLIGLTQSQVTEILKISGIDKHAIIPVEIGKKNKIFTTNETNRIIELLNNANKTESDWLKTVSTYDPKTGSLNDMPTQTELNTLASLLLNIINELKLFGYKLDENKGENRENVFTLNVDDGAGSWIPGLGYKKL